MLEVNGVPGSPRLFEGVLEVDGVPVGPDEHSAFVWRDYCKCIIISMLMKLHYLLPPIVSVGRCSSLVVVGDVVATSQNWQNSCSKKIFLSLQ